MNQNNSMPITSRAPSPFHHQEDESTIARSSDSQVVSVSTGLVTSVPSPLWELMLFSRQLPRAVVAYNRRSDRNLDFNIEIDLDRVPVRPELDLTISKRATNAETETLHTPAHREKSSWKDRPSWDPNPGRKHDTPKKGLSTSRKSRLTSKQSSDHPPHVSRTSRVHSASNDRRNTRSRGRRLTLPNPWHLVSTDCDVLCHEAGVTEFHQTIVTKIARMMSVVTKTAVDVATINVIGQDEDKTIRTTAMTVTGPVMIVYQKTTN